MASNAKECPRTPRPASLQGIWNRKECAEAGVSAKEFEKPLEGERPASRFLRRRTRKNARGRRGRHPSRKFGPRKNAPKPAPRPRNLRNLWRASGPRVVFYGVERGRMPADA